MKKNYKYFRNWLIYILILIIIFSVFAAFQVFNKDKMQIMNRLDFDISLNEDGSMNVSEIWDIYVKNTGTLFKDFYKTDKYPITDVSVINLDTNTKLEDLGEEEYNVPEGMYYAEEISTNTVEIAFGTGKSKSSGNQRYQISYKIDNVIDSYNDFQQFYWKFLDKSNNIPCKEINGTIKLPEGITNIDNLLVWGHGNINGEINKTATNEVQFKIHNFDANNMLEVRVITKDKIFNSPENIHRYEYLNNVLKEEDIWAKQTNKNIRNHRIFVIVLAIIEIGIIVYLIIQYYKFYKISKQKDDGIIKKNLKYFRDIPREKTSTPGEADFLYHYDNENDAGETNPSDLIAANILNLCLKGYISIEKKQDDLYISIIKEASGLKDDEKEIYYLLKDAIGEKEGIKVKQLNKFAKSNYSNYNNHVSKMLNDIKQNLYKEGLVDKEKERLYRASNNILPIIFAGVLFAIIVYNAVGLIPIFSPWYIVNWGIDILGRLLDSLIICVPLIIILILLDRVHNKAKDKIYKLTQKGEDERAQWKGLGQYLKDYSLIDEKGVFDIVIWEKYLVFATAMGISKNVIAELKAKYPDVFTEEYWQEHPDNFIIMSMACNPVYTETPCGFNHFTSNINSSYRTMTSTLAAHSASSSGGGGGFSSGGGGGGGGAGMGGR